MRQLGCILPLIGFVLLLAGCGDHSPPKQGGMEYSKLVSKPGENVLYEAIDLQYLIDNATSKPAVVIISFNTSSSPSGQLIGYRCGFGNGRCKYFRVWSGKSRKQEIPFIENDLILTGKLPVYYAIKKNEISKTTLTVDEFAQLQAAIENEDYIKAKQIVTEKEQLCI
jgi:hypothetical protein